MSANNVYVVHELNGKWYGWDTNAEESMADKDNKRTLLTSKALVSAPTRHEAEHLLEATDLYYPEYGYAHTVLPKDGLPLEFVDDQPHEALSRNNGIEVDTGTLLKEKL